jgi:hypothetical protein
VLGTLDDRAMSGEQFWERHDDRRLDALPVRRWLGGRSLAPALHRDELEPLPGTGRRQNMMKFPGFAGVKLLASINGTST